LGKAKLTTIRTYMTEVPESVGQDYESTDSTPMPNESELLEYFVRLIANSLSYASEAGTRGEAIEDHLSPPTGTSFVKRQVVG
jgi:hypothetical protein